MKSLDYLIASAMSLALFSSASLGAAAGETSSRANVLVVGGTPAGVAAAVAAARRGENVTLVAADDELGGVLTEAMMDQWDLNLAPGGASVEAGIFHEIYDGLGDAFTPAAASHFFERMLATEPRIAVRYDEIPVAAHATALEDGASIDDVTFRNGRSGAESHLAAPYVVDATDFGDVAALAGARYDLGRQDSGLDDRTQAVTLVFTIRGVDWKALAASYDPALDGPGGVLNRRAWGYSKLVADYEPRSSDVLVRDLNLGLMPNGEVTVNAVDVVGIDGLKSADIERARRLSEVEAERLVGYLRGRLPGFQRARVGIFAPDVYVRETRHFAGLERLTTSDVWLGEIPADSIGLSSYPIDLHPVDATGAQAFAPIRHVYGIPFGALVPRGLDNLLLAGPAISASHLAAGSARVVPTTIEEGEAAGVAAAQADRAGIDFVELAEQPARVVALRAELAQDGTIVARVRSRGRLRPAAA
ncbi:MAG: FAD-dependent oxidoreductase [Candidatus Eremiobacteraeota bacterium]|nr:FAD-dependent oxidoreductase [Candidatus Eremiobacteraeota bacterium]